MHIDHINIRASSKLLRQVKEFYCYILDLKEGDRPDFLVNGFWLYGNDKPLIHLTESDGHEKSEKTGCFDHVAFQVFELNGIIKKLEQLKIEHKVNYIQDVAMHQVFFRDPTGLRIEVNCFEGNSV